MILKKVQHNLSDRWLKFFIGLLLVAVLLLPVLTFLPGSTEGSHIQIESPGLVSKQLSADDVEVAVNWGSRPQGQGMPIPYECDETETDQPAEAIAYVNWGSAPIQIIPTS